MRKLTLLLVVLALLLCACTEPPAPSTAPSTEPTTEPTTVPTEPTAPQIDFVESGPVKLTNVGSFKHTASLMFAYGDFVLNYDKNVPDAPYQLLSPLGQAQLDGHFNAAAYYGNGIALVSHPDGLVGLVDYRTGKELAPCEASQVMQLSRQYFLLVYADGSVRFVDALGGGIVPGVVLEALPDGFGVWGDRFYVRHGDVTDVYNADGTLAASLENVTVVGNAAIQPAFGGVNVYGADVTPVAQLKHASQRLDLLEGGYLRFYDEGVYTVLDLQGNPVGTDTYLEIHSVAEGRIIARKDTGWGMTAVTGEEIAPYSYADIEYLGDGQFLLEESEGRLVLVNMSGLTVDITGRSGGGYYYYTETDAGRAYLLDDNTTLTLTGELEELDFGLVSTEDGIYELHTGGLLLSGYDRYAYCDGYVYAQIYGIWTVFQVEIAE